jgi:streptogramin lyase
VISARRLIGAALLFAAAAAPLRGQSITEFTLPDPAGFPRGIVAGRDGAMWFTEFRNKIGRITTIGEVIEFDVPTFNSTPYGIAAGPDGNVWFTEISEGKIGRITPSGEITEFSLAVRFSSPSSITPGPDGNLWFTERDNERIGRITPSGVITEFVTPTPASGPTAIVAGPDGNLWFTEALGKIGRITPSGTITEFSVGNFTSFGLTDITAGADGALWFVQQACCGASEALWRITVEGAKSRFPFPPGTGLLGIGTGPDGSLLLTALTNSIILRTASGIVRYFAIPTPLSSPQDVTTGADGAAWFTEGSAGKIGHIVFAPADIPTLTTPMLFGFAFLLVIAGAQLLTRR